MNKDQQDLQGLKVIPEHPERSPTMRLVTTNFIVVRMALGSRLRLRLLVNILQKVGARERIYLGFDSPPFLNVNGLGCRKAPPTTISLLLFGPEFAKAKLRTPPVKWLTS